MTTRASVKPSHFLPKHGLESGVSNVSREGFGCLTKAALLSCSAEEHNNTKNHEFDANLMRSACQMVGVEVCVPRASMRIQYRRGAAE